MTDSEKSTTVRAKQCDREEKKSSTEDKSRRQRAKKLQLGAKTYERQEKCKPKQKTRRRGKKYGKEQKGVLVRGKSMSGWKFKARMGGTTDKETKNITTLDTLLHF